MTKLFYTNYEIPAADLGRDSALPDIHVNDYIRASISLSDNISAEDGKYIGKGMISTLLPYTITDGYDRRRAPRAFRAAILENECLRAVFLPEIGGRLWSLYDKKGECELLYKNDVFQPANLALRNAWFSGGVEWNVSIKGHNPLTCSPLFTGTVYNEAGEPILRMYEYERKRGVVYIIEATLKEDALVMNITIENTAKTDTYMYWWSNIAVPETPKTRVLVPAAETFYCGYTDGGYFLDKAPLPLLDGRDVTYASSSMRSRDFFFNIPNKEEKWVAALNEEGRGLLQFSDPILKGRKLFVWGQHQGGRYWNEWLSDKAGAYVEIQAGLLKTQLEHFVMPAESAINWRECYCAATLAPTVAHGDFKTATAAMDKVVRERKRLLSPDTFRVVREDALEAYGSGWGALENRMRETPISRICRFPEESFTEEQADWLALLDGQPLPTHPVGEPRATFAVGPAYLALLEKKPREDWHYYNQLGILRYAEGDFDGAAEAFARSFAIEDNAWARRNLAQIQKNIRKQPDAAAENMLCAVRLLSDYLPLAVECAYALMNAARYAEFIALYEKMPAALRESGRLRMLVGACYSKLGDTARACAYINESLVVPDIKEGEYAISNIWTEIYAQILAKERGVAPEALSAEEVLAAYPLPRVLDYRMH
ncbi:MAG: DUF5107 domain-containing protein [Clostridia bacterium]|nr:DUF5107 domain-containing protein [Clostridia bacterium]